MTPQLQLPDGTVRSLEPHKPITVRRGEDGIDASDLEVSRAGHLLITNVERAVRVEWVHPSTNAIGSANAKLMVDQIGGSQPWVDQGSGDWKCIPANTKRLELQGGARVACYRSKQSLRWMHVMAVTFDASAATLSVESDEKEEDSTTRHHQFDDSDTDNDDQTQAQRATLEEDDQYLLQPVSPESPLLPDTNWGERAPPFAL
ncbi:hypothetical protein RI367_000607 [Sorochytrium milnesiophthora]